MMACQTYHDCTYFVYFAAAAAVTVIPYLELVVKSLYISSSLSELTPASHETDKMYHFRALQQQN